GGLVLVRRIALMKFEIGADLAAPIGGELQLVLADAGIGRFWLLGIGRLFLERLPCGCFLRGGLLRRLGLHRGDLRVVLHRLLRVVLGDDAIGIFGLVHLVLRKIALLHFRLLLGELGRGLRRIGIGTRWQI